MLRALILLLCATAVAPAATDPLLDGFRNPPREARLRCYWWWLNGNVTTAAITRDLEAMKSKGFGGAIIVDAGGAEQRGNAQVPAGPQFGGPEWRALFRHALAEAKRLDLELSLNILSGWNLGGPGVEPKDAAKLAMWSRATVTGPADVDHVLPKPKSAGGFYRDVAVIAYPLLHGVKPSHEPIRQLDLKAASKEFGMSTPDTRSLLEDAKATPGEEDTHVADVVDISSKMDADGRLRWHAPVGEWEILRFGYGASGAVVSTSSETWQGLAIDYLDHESLEIYWQRVVAPLVEDARPYIGRTLKYLVTDSWELGGVNWTGRFRDEFRHRRGYDILPWLPAFNGRIVESRESTTRFLNDLRRTVGDLVADEHYRAFERLAARDGLGMHPESGGPHGAPIDALQNLGIGSFPQMEFWAKAKTHRITDEQRFFVKEAASASHIYGKTYVAAEAFTSIGPQWEETLWDNLKPTFDKAVCEGLNLVVWHTFTSSPPEMGQPGQEYFAGSHFNPNITWWHEADAFTGYLNRVSFLMQQGVFAGDVLYYYGDHVPNFVRLKTTDPAKVLPGYDYDAVDLYGLLTRVSVRDGRLVLPDGTTYRVLVLPEIESMSPSALRRIAALVRDGAKVVGPRPKRSSSLAGDDAEFQRVAEELWGAGRIDSRHTAREMLLAKGVAPDFEFAPDTDFIHRRTADADIYYVSNQTGKTIDAKALFRVEGRTPELWDPVTGRVRDARVYSSEKDGRTAVPLRLHPYGSMLVVFRKPAGPHEPALPAVAHGKLPSPVNVAGPWTVKWAQGWGAPAESVFTKLMSWTDSPTPGIRYFSGTAVYSAEVQLPASLFGEGRALELDLGDVREIARVRWNGQDLGVLWTVPRVANITTAAHAGGNRIEVEVTNLWPNRLIGDQTLPEAQRRTKTNIRKFTATSPLMPSGLLGPVIVRSVLPE